MVRATEAPWLCQAAGCSSLLAGEIGGAWCTGVPRPLTRSFYPGVTGLCALVHGACFMRRFKDTAGSFWQLLTGGQQPLKRRFTHQRTMVAPKDDPLAGDIHGR